MKVALDKICFQASLRNKNLFCFSAFYEAKNFVGLLEFVFAPKYHQYYRYVYSFLFSFRSLGGLLIDGFSIGLICR